MSCVGVDKTNFYNYFGDFVTFCKYIAYRNLKFT